MSSEQKPKPTQYALVRKHLMSGKTLTPIQALEKFGCYRLAAVVNKLRKEGLQISTELMKGGEHAYAKYKIIK